MKPRGLTELLGDIEDRLVELTPAAIKKSAGRARSPLWCCGLVLDSSIPPFFPPELAIATVADRDERRRRRSSTRR